MVQPILIWVGISVILSLLFMAGIVFLIIISKKTHAIIEFKSNLKGTPIAMFFQDNKYCEWKNTSPEAGLVEDEEHGAFVIDATYIDKKTKNVLIPFNTGFGMSLSVKGAKLADDLSYYHKEQHQRRDLKKQIIDGKVPENRDINTLRTSINFSSIKNFVSPILPHNIRSKIHLTTQLRLKGMGKGNMQNVILLIISALGASILGGLLLKAILG